MALYNCQTKETIYLKRINFVVFLFIPQQKLHVGRVLELIAFPPKW
jgi:hypothetical protein